MRSSIALWNQRYANLFRDLVRVTLGAGLCLEGGELSGGAPDVSAGLALAHPYFGRPEVIVFGALVFLIGGAMLALGMWTRVSAIILVPNMLAAMMLVRVAPWAERARFDLGLLVLLLLAGYVITGAGPFSADAYIKSRAEQADAADAARAYSGLIDVDSLLNAGLVDIQETTTLTDIRTYEIRQAEKSAINDAASHVS